MAVKAKQQYYADETTIKKEAREFGMIDELKDKLDSIEYGAQVNIIEEVQENGVPLEIVDKSVNVLVPEVIDNLYTIDPNNSLSAKQGKILYDMIKNLLARGRFLSTWNTATGLPVTNPEESPYEYKAGDYYIVGIVAAEGGTNFRPEPGEYVINVASDEQETSEVHVSDIYVYDGEKWILLINSTREIAVDDYVDHTYQSTNPVENQAIAREIDTKQNKFYTVSTTQPSNPVEGDEWYDATNDKVFYWDGTQWKEMGGGEDYTAGLHISIDPNDNNKISVVEWNATSSALGLVKLGSDTVQSTSPNNVTSTTGRTYRIQANGSGQLMVNVPWTDTTYSAGTGIAISNNRVISCTVKPVTVGPTAPSTPGTGDLWYDTTKNTMFLYKNNAWTIIGPEIYPITKADYDALTPAEQGDGRFFLITDNDGTIYVDWENVQNRPMYIGTTSPANPCEGYLWYDTTNDVLKIYNGTQWNEVGGGTTYTAGNGISISNGEISIDTTVVATKTDLNSKQDVFHTTSSTAPSNPNEGDEWYDTADDVLKVYDGTNWIVTGKTYTAGDGINIDTSNNNEISVDLNDIVGDGLYVDGNSNLSLDKYNIVGDGLEIDSNNKLKVDPNDFVNTSNGLTVDNNGDIDINTSTIAMNLDGDGLSVNGSTNKLDVYPMEFVNTLHGLTVDNNGDIDIDSSTLAMNLEGDGLSYNGSTNKLDVYPMEFVNTSNGLTIDSNGDIDIDTSSLTTNLAGHGLSVNGSTNKLDVYPIEIAGNGLTANGNVLDVYPMAFVETSNGLTIDSNGKVDIDTATLATNLAGTGLYYDSVNNNISIDATEIATQRDLASKQDKAESGSGAPTTTPSYIGEMYVDTTNDTLYVAIGTTSSNDWIVVDTNTEYTAGDGIDITSNEISVDVTDIIGNGLSEDANNNIIVDSTIVALKSDLSNYYTKTQTYTKTEVDNLIANVGSFEAVATLPSADTADTKKIYLLGPIGTGADKYEEYIVTEQTTPGHFESVSEISHGVMNRSYDGASGQDFPIQIDGQYLSNVYLAFNNLEGENFRAVGVGDGNTSELAFDLTEVTLPYAHNTLIESPVGYATFDEEGGYSVTFDLYASSSPLTWVGASTQKVWTKIGETSIDLSGYATTTALTNGLATKQDTLTASDGIDIDGSNNISVDVTDIIGTGLSEDANNNIIVDTTVIQGKLTAGPNIDITNNVISADTQFVLVDTLPSIYTADENKIYILGPIGTGADKYEEWIVAEQPAQGHWESASTIDHDSVTVSDSGAVWNGSFTIQDKYIGIDNVEGNSQLSLSEQGSSDGYYYITGASMPLVSAWGAYEVPVVVCNVYLGASSFDIYYSDSELTWSTTAKAWTKIGETSPDLSTKQDKATSGSTAPSTTPSYVGEMYVDTTNDKLYVATGTTSSSDWTEVGAGSGDMLYSDFGWDTLTGASVTLALRSEITPSANFTVNKPNDLKDGQFYVLRVITGATAYTMTLGTDVTNPYSEDLTLSANTIANFTFLAKDGELELQPSTDVPSYTAGDGIDITNNEISVDTDVIQPKLTAGAGISIAEGQICVEESDRKGPAPSGFHVPSTAEWQGVKTIMNGLSLTTGADWRINLHMPFAGFRSSEDSSVFARGNYAFLLSSSPSSDNNHYANYLRLSSSDADADRSDVRAYGYSVRAFKNTYVAPDSSWIVAQGTLGSAGIFWNQSEGLISITSDGSTGYTIMDKNLGATTVYNNGDTLTQANMGNMYQWGNNYGFPSTGSVTTASTQVDASAYGPDNYYESDTFITGSNDWSSVHNDDLWGDTSNSTHQECTGGGPLTISTTVNGFNPSNAGTEGQVLTKTSTGYNWADAQGGGDMLYADFNWATKTGETITLDLNSTITPSANFTVNAPATIKDGQVYILRVINGLTVYTMTLGTGITNPYSTSTALTSNGVDQFVFQAIGGSLELLPDSDVDISGKQDKATSGSSTPPTAPSYIGQQYVDTTSIVPYIATGTTGTLRDDWQALPILSKQNGALLSVKIWVGSQTDYEALATKDPNTLYFTTNVVSGS